jgi:hypothetical protein
MIFFLSHGIFNIILVTFNLSPLCQSLPLSIKYIFYKFMSFLKIGVNFIPIFFLAKKSVFTILNSKDILKGKG